MKQVLVSLTDLKQAMEELEGAVQLPCGEAAGAEQVVSRFLPVMSHCMVVLRRLVELHHGVKYEHDENLIEAAHTYSLLQGDRGLWLRLTQHFERLCTNRAEVTEQEILVMAQDIRACSSMLWETYDMLSARFRYQTQVRPAVTARMLEAAAG